jgi:hypothetical protein
MITLDSLTTPNAQRLLRDDGLFSLGLSAVRLCERWSLATPAAGDYDPAALTLTLNPICAPFFGILEFVDDASEFAEVSGTPIAGPAGVLRFHPQAFARLQQIASWRYSSPEPRPIKPVGIQPPASLQVQPRAVQIRPLPSAMVIRGANTDRAPQFHDFEVPLDLSGTVSFHDTRGLIIDPLAVAAMFADLLQALPGLADPRFRFAPAGAGGVASIAGLRPPANLVHFVDPHGWAFQPGPSGGTLSLADAQGVQGAIISTPLLTLPAGNSIVGSGPSPLLWGWGEDGWLRRVPLTPPPLPTPAPAINLPHQFLRVVVVDTDWHLLGNRTTRRVRNVPPDDGLIPASLMPIVRDTVELTYLPDGIDVITAGNQVINQQAAPGDTPMMFVVSPVIDAGVPVPPAGQAGRWPQWPPFGGTLQDFPNPPPNFAQGMTAQLIGTRDVVVTLPADVVPDGAHVRIYPRTFVEIATIGEAPSFLRGDGAATIAAAGQPVRILLINPLRLLAEQPMPDQASLVLDIVVQPRLGRRRLRAAVAVTVNGGPAPAAPPDVFAPPADIMQPLLAGAAWILSVAPVPLFGVPRTVTPPAGTPSSPIDLVRALASETVPRQGPRLPMMARFETVLTRGGNDPAIGNGALRWAAVVSGARWARESLCDRPTDGNPGFPAGPDVHAPGVRVGGVLAYDAARHATKRVQPIIPLPGTVGSPSWMLMLASPNMRPPQTPAGDVFTGVGACLQTVAAVCETPELSLPEIDLSPTAVTADDVADAIVDAFDLPVTINIPPGDADRVVDEVRREFFVARNGVRDALWSLSRVLREARELVYIESPQFARTAISTGGPDPFDLVEVLRAGLRANPALQVIICTPRLTDIDPAFGGFARQHFAARAEAVNALRTVPAPPGENDQQRAARERLQESVRARILAFHPVGFPGRDSAIRTTSVIVDDVYALVGTSHIRRRGMTLDGSLDIASFDSVFREGYSSDVQQYRRRIMAEKLGVPVPAARVPGSGDWLRLMRPRAAFSLVSDLLAQGGLGRILPLWAGPSDASVLAATADMADPDGSDGSTFVTAFASVLSESPQP